MTATALTHDGWMALTRTEYVRLGELLDDLAPDEWLRDTDCAGWRVREVVAHLVGAGESNASFRELLRQARAGRGAARGRDLVDGMNDVQVRERTGLTPGQLLLALRDVAPRAVAGRARYPAWLRSTPVPLGPPIGTRPLGHLLGPVYTRDLWMHRVDISRAVGRTPVLTSEHDGALAADVVTEWARAHGRRYRLTLTGPAGGEYASADAADAAPLVLDAVEFLRGVSGRAPDDVPYGTLVNF